MFDLFRDQRRAPHAGKTPLLISTSAHLIVAAVLAAAPLMYVRAESPPIPDMVTVVLSAAPLEPPPPPPPPPPAAGSKSMKPQAAKAEPSMRVPAAPVEAPGSIVQEETVERGSDDGIPGGVEGGVFGGVVGGIAGGLVTTEVPPPPPPPLPDAPHPPIERAPARIGGELKAPALLERVDPAYPPMAARAQVQGVVILEAVVGADGRVEEVRVLRSIALLDTAAVEAVRKWRYSPLLLNGQAERFVLTVTLSFSLAGS
jgi:protein TonB